VLFRSAYDLYRDSKQIEPGLLDNNYLTIRFDTAVGNFTPTSNVLKYNTNTMSKGWHHIAFTFNSGTGLALFYVDGEVKDSLVLSSGITTLSYEQKNKFYIGNTNGFNDLYSQDYLLNDTPTMVGKLDDLRVYDKVLTTNDILVLSRKKLEFANIPFLVDIPTRQYLEEIDKFNMHRTPGFKSNVYNIRILNSEINDDTVREMHEVAVNVFELTDDDLSNIQSAQFINVLWHASELIKLRAKEKSALKAVKKAQPKVVKVPSVAPPQRVGSKTDGKNLRAANERLARTGDKNSAAYLIETLGL
jgi:hypothetical protein